MPPPAPLGRYALGALRGRLPTLSQEAGLFVQVSYPADAKAQRLKAEPFPYFRPEVADAIAAGKGLPPWVMKWVTGSRRQLDPPSAALASDDCAWPIIIFSSGIWGSCEMYTQLCREFASFGAIVVAVEWQDGSGVYAVDGDTGERIPYTTPPFDNPTDEQICGFRRPFLERRARDLDCVVAALKTLAAKSDDESPLVQVFRHGDVDKMILLGHSFGASNAVHYLHGLKARDVPCPFRGAVLADLWLPPLPLEVQQSELPVPFALFMSGEWAEFQAARQRAVVQANGSRCIVAASVPGTYHQWISETHNWLPQWLTRRMGLMGPAEHVQSYQATIRGMQLAIEALLDPAPSSALGQVADINRDILVPFGAAAL